MSALPNKAADPEVRRSGVGGSDVSVIAGLNPWKSPYELYLEKTGALPPLAVEDRERDMRLTFGHLFEDVIAEGYSIVRGKREGREVKVRRDNETLRMAGAPWMMAHIDRRVVGERRGLECKNVGAGSWSGQWGPDGSDEVPDYMLLQVQWYMRITGYPIWDLAALHGGNDLRVYTIPFDQEIAGTLERMGQEFWGHVERQEPPEPSWQSSATTDLLKRLYPDTDGSVIEADQDILNWHWVRRHAHEQMTHYGNVVEGCDNHVRAFMGDATFLRFPDGSGYQRKRIERKGYEVAPASWIDLRYVKQWKGDK